MINPNENNNQNVANQSEQNKEKLENDKPSVSRSKIYPVYYKHVREQEKEKGLDK